MKRLPLAAALIVALFAGSFARSDAFLDKTRFVAHLGIAYFCFHHWVMRPYEQGSFTPGAPHRISSLVKGGAALLFAVHEVHVSQRIAQKSNDPLLQKLDGALANLGTSFAEVGQKLKSGNISPGDVPSLKSLAATVASGSAAAGAPIHDKAIPSVPGM